LNQLRKKRCFSISELQKVLLIYTCIYFVVKGALALGLYTVLVVKEREARLKHTKYKVYINAKRADEQERYEVAYALYNKKHLLETQTQMLLTECS